MNHPRSAGCQDLDARATELLQPVAALLTGSTYDRWLLIAILARLCGNADALAEAADVMDRLTVEPPF